MISIICGLGSALMFASNSLVSSRVVKIITPWSVVAWLMLVGLVITLPLIFLSGVPADLSGEDLGWMAAAGIGNVGGFVLASMAFRVGKVGIVAPVLATQGALAAVIAAILGESIVPIVAFLLLVVVCGVVLAAMPPSSLVCRSTPPVT